MMQESSELLALVKDGEAGEFAKAGIITLVLGGG